MIFLIATIIMMYFCIDTYIDIIKELDRDDTPMDLSGIIKDVAPDWDRLEEMTIKDIIKEVVNENN